MMIKSYLKTSLRSLFKHKLFSLTNIAGLTIGVLCCLLIMVYVAHEVNCDHWNRNLDRLVRPYADINFRGNVMNMAVTGSPLAPDAADVLPEIEDWCRMRNYGSYLVKVEGSSRQNISIEHVLSADSTFFNLFPVPLLEGDPMSCLKTPRSAAISESINALVRSA